MCVLDLIQCAYPIASFGRRQPAITGNSDHVVVEEDLSDWVFVDTTCVYLLLEMATGAEEAPAGVDERGSDLEREGFATEVARFT